MSFHVQHSSKRSTHLDMSEIKFKIDQIQDHMCIEMCQKVVLEVDLFTIFTARKRSLGQGNVFTHVCQLFFSQGRGCGERG